jgi:hypothetical protein
MVKVLLLLSGLAVLLVSSREMFLMFRDGSFRARGNRLIVRNVHPIIFWMNFVGLMLLGVVGAALICWQLLTCCDLLSNDAHWWLMQRAMRRSGSGGNCRGGGQPGARLELAQHTAIAAGDGCSGCNGRRLVPLAAFLTQVPQFGRHFPAQICTALILFMHMLDNRAQLPHLSTDTVTLPLFYF